eukprot:Protomagalhaensia_sp_Gyna_25__4275@NODE_38_length_6740_cov_65_576929_g27_i0_p8_GENE_NODE_38_length_6740_cov_65_576929_g27_i0NODE_38_length_6740_cov_65_576929_g27_i0_p8_ORF_typecomplete_len135_score25_70CDC48_N/PF02359_18/4_1e06PEX1N/PF09262_11/5_1e03PEX1N/PF09262_11/0_011CDC48_2/PF02933_17/0_092_NODE_38_length_6740_cov_65_576929_g27_i046985102
MDTLRLKNGDVVQLAGKSGRALCLVQYSQELDDWELALPEVVARNVGARSGELVTLHAAHDVPFARDVDIVVPAADARVRRTAQHWFSTQWRFVASGNRFPLRLSDGTVVEMLVENVNPSPAAIADAETHIHFR